MAPAQQNKASPLVMYLTQIPEEGLTLREELLPGSLQLPQEEGELVGPVQVRGALTKVAEQIYFHGTVSGVLTLLCGRCLEATRSDFVSDVRVAFLPPTSATPSEGDETADMTNELDLYMHDGMTIDLRPFVHDQVVLAFPIQPLCRPDCAGLCQLCGGNRNEAPCTCQVESGDVRFALLKHMSFPPSS